MSFLTYRVAMSAIHQLPYEEIVRIQSKALFSKQEEDLLSTVTVVRLYFFWGSHPLSAGLTCIIFPPCVTNHHHLLGTIYRSHLVGFSIGLFL